MCNKTHRALAQYKHSTSRYFAASLVCWVVSLTVIMAGSGGFCSRSCQADEVLDPSQAFIVSVESASIMAGDEPAGTVPLGTVIMVTRAQGNWRYSADTKGWIHLRHLISPAEAIPRFTREIETKPTSRAYQLRGIAYMAQQNWSRAAQDFEKAYDLGESAIALHLNLGACYQRMGELAAALEEYDGILKTYPDDFAANLARGNILLQQGQYQAALRDFEKAISLNSTVADAHNSQGVALRMLGRYEDAITAYTQAIELDASRADALSNRGYAQKNLGELAAALKDYEAAVALAPDSNAIQNDLAWFLATTADVSLRNATRAVEISEAVCQQTMNQHGEYLDTLAAAYACAGRFPAAIEAARLALTIMADNPEAIKTRERLKLYQQQQPYIEQIKPAQQPASTPTSPVESVAPVEP